MVYELAVIFTKILQYIIMEVDDLDNNSEVALPSDSEGNQEDIDNGIVIGEQIGRQISTNLKNLLELIIPQSMLTEM